MLVPRVVKFVQTGSRMGVSKDGGSAGGNGDTGSAWEDDKALEMDGVMVTRLCDCT